MRRHLCGLLLGAAVALVAVSGAHAMTGGDGGIITGETIGAPTLYMVAGVDEVIAPAMLKVDDTALVEIAPLTPVVSRANVVLSGSDGALVLTAAEGSTETGI